MFGSFIKKIIGSKNERELKKLWPIVAKINAMESSIAALSDEQLRGKTTEFKERNARGESLDALLPEAFAVCREASKRVLGMRHFDVQLIGGMVLHSGQDRRDEDRRRQDPGRHPAGLPECHQRQGRPRGYGQ